MHRIRGALLALLALVLVPAGSLAAQSDWEVAVTGDVGYIFSIRTLGQNTGEQSELQNFQVLADLENTMTVSAGVEVGRVGSNLSFRGRYQTTIDGYIAASVGLCSIQLVLPPECTPFGIDVSVRSFVADMRYLRGNPGDLIRPLFSLGLGIRSWSFGEQITCDLTTDPEWVSFICPRGRDIFQNVSSSPLLVFGLGLEAGFGPVEFALEGQPQFSAFRAGVGTASGNTTIDVNVSFAGKIRLF